MKIKTIFLILLLSQHIFADIKPGKLVNCSSGQQCSSCGYSHGQQWQFDPNTQKCYVYDCNTANESAPMLLIEFNDNFCLSCNSDDSVTYSNGQKCVNTTDSCYQRTKAWTDSDCQLCGQGQYAAFGGIFCSQKQCDQKQTYTDKDCQDCNIQYVASTDKSKCVNNYGVSCTQSANQQINNQFCQICNSPSFYADLNLQSCVQISDTCGIYNNPKGYSLVYSYQQYQYFNSRKTPWTDADCKLCGSKYALPDQSGCFTCEFLKQSSKFTDQFCQICQGSGYFANVDGSDCVKSSDSCGRSSFQYGQILNQRTLSWTQSDCILCNAGQYVYTQQQGCFSCPKSGQSVQYNDEICQKCQGKDYFAASDGLSCVKTSDTCQNKRYNLWTDNECQLCKLGQFAYADQSGCFYCNQTQNNNKPFYFTDELCQKCQGKGFFATVDNQGCAQSSDTCGVTQQYVFQQYSNYYNNNLFRKTPWTDSDCQLCKAGQYAYANNQGCYYCPINQTTFQSNYNKNFYFQNYVEYNFSDEVCQKCFGQGYFADYDRQSCVKSSDSCQGTVMLQSSYTYYQPLRKSPWTDIDCQICKLGKQALPNKSGCYSCPNQSLNTLALNDEICQLCYGSGYYATSDGLSCVQSKDTCGKRYTNQQQIFPSLVVQRQSPWTDEDCRLCNAGQYATFDHSSCFTCSTNNFQFPTNIFLPNLFTDYMCQKCIGKSYFASPIGYCVQSSDSCGIYLPTNSSYVPIPIVDQNFMNQIPNIKQITISFNRKTAWTDQDCFQCQLGYFSNFDKSFCSPFECNNKSQQNWTDDTCQQCSISYQLKNSTSTIIKYYASKDRTQCVQTYQSCNSTTNFTDSFCQVCNKNPKLFASLDGQQCIQLQDSCDSNIRKALWNDSDCQKCKKGQHATFDKKSCTKTANCLSQKAPFTDDFCQQCSQGSQYASIDGANCLNIKHSCKYTGVYWTEEECQLCYSNKLHVNILGTSCVQSSDLCQNRESQWTDKDCKLCYPQKNILSNELGTQCIDINCKKTSGWTDFDCFRCNPLKPKASANKNSCQA
ncbi:hypothetical protein ABPG74_005944 [Tetrahymena malaccensis]